jgi:hypothetical protein
MVFHSLPKVSGTGYSNCKCLTVRSGFDLHNAVTRDIQMEPESMAGSFDSTTFESAGDASREYSRVT